jgi:hypothetical protein
VSICLIYFSSPLAVAQRIDLSALRADLTKKEKEATCRALRKRPSISLSLSLSLVELVARAMRAFFLPRRDKTAEKKKKERKMMYLRAKCKWVTLRGKKKDLISLNKSRGAFTFLSREIAINRVIRGFRRSTVRFFSLLRQ